MESNKEKPFGVYAGIWENGKEDLDKMTEINVYGNINYLGGILYQDSQSKSHPERFGGYYQGLSFSQALDIQYAIEYLVVQTKRFGVDVEVPTNGEEVKRTDDYNAWFSWWDAYMDGLSAEDKKRISQASLEEIEQFRPTGTWKQEKTV